jgi:hypothetical protein
MISPPFVPKLKRALARVASKVKIHGASLILGTCFVKTLAVAPRLMHPLAAAQNALVELREIAAWDDK